MTEEDFGGWNKRIIEKLAEHEKYSAKQKMKIPTIKASYRELARRLAKVETELKKWRPEHHGVAMHVTNDIIDYCDEGFWLSEGVLMNEAGEILRVGPDERTHKPEDCPR